MSEHYWLPLSWALGWASLGRSPLRVVSQIVIILWVLGSDPIGFQGQMFRGFSLKCMSPKLECLVRGLKPLLFRENLWVQSSLLVVGHHGGIGFMVR